MCIVSTLKAELVECCAIEEEPLKDVTPVLEFNWFTIEYEDGRDTSDVETLLSALNSSVDTVVKTLVLVNCCNVEFTEEIDINNTAVGTSLAEISVEGEEELVTVVVYMSTVVE